MNRWLIAGLGNPGQRYHDTRHNAGFWVVDGLEQDERMVWKEQPKFEGFLASMKNYLLLKPDTFMNESGKSVARVVRFYTIPLTQLIVVHDDLDLALGSAKVSWARGPHIHNGVLSVEAALGSKLFWRVRVGVDSRSPAERRVMSGERYVLKHLDDEEKQKLSIGVDAAGVIVADIMGGRYVQNG